MHDGINVDLVHVLPMKPLAKELGIRVLPTFKIFKKGKVVKEVTGTKLDELVTAIEAARLS